MSERAAAPRTPPCQLLPREAYVSQEWFERERAELFSRCWTFAGMTSDVPNPGDYSCVQAGHYLLFILRGKDGRIRAFHNLCRHRGAKLLDGTGNAGQNLRCLYHYWTYNLDGSLLSLPLEKELFPSLDRKAHSLKPACLGIYGDAVFVHPDPRPAEDFDAFLGPLAQMEWPHHAADMVEFSRVHYDIDTNWKLFFENAVDVYHLAFLHEKTLGGPLPKLSDEKTHIRGRHMIFVNQEGTGSQRASADLPRIHPSDVEPYPGIYFFFPGFFTLPSPGMFLTTEVIALAPNKTRVTGRAYCAPGGEQKALALIEALFPTPGRKAYQGEDPEPVTIRNIEGHPLESGNFQLEDMWICERMQQAMESPAHQTGRLALAGESGVIQLQRNVLDFVPLQRGREVDASITGS